MRDDTPASPMRRRLFAGAGSAGALAAVAVVLPEPAVEPKGPEPKPAPPKGGGYHVTEHVLRYYQTAKV